MLRVPISKEVCVDSQSKELLKREMQLNDCKAARNNVTDLVLYVAIVKIHF